MSARQKNTPLLDGPRVVGTVHSPGSLKRALALRPGEVDFLELRVDHFASNPAALFAAAAGLRAPMIITVRHVAEGGALSLEAKRRRELYEQFFSVAAFIDVELRSCKALKSLLAAARERGVRVIVSDHHFRGTPPLSRLRVRLARGREAGADVVKLAALTSSPSDLVSLLSLFPGEKRQVLSVMGMGPLGKVSRLLFAAAGISSELRLSGSAAGSRAMGSHSFESTDQRTRDEVNQPWPARDEEPGSLASGEYFDIRST